jgi:hypothetical protein
MSYRREETEIETTVLVIKNKRVGIPLIYCEQCEGRSMFLSVDLAYQVLKTDELLFDALTRSGNVHWHLGSENTRMICTASLARIIDFSRRDNQRK